jgi:hypothetical protein
MVNRRSERSRIFISYSHKDQPWLDRLLVPLKPMVRDGGLRIWTDRDIPSGSLWEREIKSALDAANVAVLLISPNFMASDFIAKVELPSLLTAAKQKGLTVLWLAVSDTRYKNTGIAGYQAVIEPSKPLDRQSSASWKKALNQVADEIEKASHRRHRVKLAGRAVVNKVGVNGVKAKHVLHLPADAHQRLPAPGHPDADHCVNLFIDRVSGGNAGQTEILRSLLHKVMIDGLQPEDAWKMLGLNPNNGRRHWFIAVQQFMTHFNLMTHFNRFLNRLLEFREAIQVPQ